MTSSVLGSREAVVPYSVSAQDSTNGKGKLAGRVVTKQAGNPVDGCAFIVCGLLLMGIGIGMLIPGVQGLHGALSIAHGGAVALVVLGSISIICSYSSMLLGSLICAVGSSNAREVHEATD